MACIPGQVFAFRRNGKPNTRVFGIINPNLARGYPGQNRSDAQMNINQIGKETMGYRVLLYIKFVQLRPPTKTS